jgi:glycosyltransferase involved in cell wall biosynthesis
MNLSIIVPAFNEERTILAVLNNLKEIDYPTFVESTEVICINDGSFDKTLEIIEEFSKDRNNFKVINSTINQGKGKSVKLGIENAIGDVYLIQDGDLELSTSDIPKMLKAMHELNVEFVNGSRYLPGVNRPLSSYRRYLANSLFTFLTSFLINVKLTDMACGYKLISKNLYSHLNLKENKFGFEAELIIKALRVRRNNIAEVPVSYFPRNEGEGKKLNNFDAFRILWTIIKYGALRMK